MLVFWFSNGIRVTLCLTGEAGSQTDGRFLLSFQDNILNKPLYLFKCLNNKHTKHRSSEVVDLINQALESFVCLFYRTLARQKLHLQLFLNCKVGGLGISDCAARKRRTNICIPL